MSEKRLNGVSDTLQFNVAQLLKQPCGAQRDYEIYVPNPALDDRLNIVGPLRGRVRFVRAGPGVLVTGRLETVIELTCSRCLATFVHPVEFEIEEEFHATIDVVTGSWLKQDEEQDDALLIDDHHILDLTEVARQDIWLSVPASPLCREECRGLCPQCGQNWNEGECTCENQVVDQRWSGLLTQMPHPGD